MKNKKIFITLTGMILVMLNHSLCGQAPSFRWPEGKKAAISLSFDDGRASQANKGATWLDTYGVKATFFVVPSAVERHLNAWKKVAATGHEIGNHSLYHPCTGNFSWSKPHALEDYSLEQMKEELATSNEAIHRLLGVTPNTFAYPCGQTYVGRGVSTKSYVPLVATQFLAGRGWLDEGPNDPAFCDLAQLTGIEMDGKDFEELLPILQEAVRNNAWIVLAGHEMGEDGPQTTRLSMLKKLVEYVGQHPDEFWLAPVGTVASYVQLQKK